MVFLTHEQALHNRVCRDLLGGNACKGEAVDTGREAGIRKIRAGPLDSGGCTTELRDFREKKGWASSQKRLAHALAFAMVGSMKKYLNHWWREE